MKFRNLFQQKQKRNSGDQTHKENSICFQNKRFYHSAMFLFIWFLIGFEPILLNSQLNALPFKL